MSDLDRIDKLYDAAQKQIDHAWKACVAIAGRLSVDLEAQIQHLPNVRLIFHNSASRVMENELLRTHPICQCLAAPVLFALFMGYGVSPQ